MTKDQAMKNIEVLANMKGALDLNSLLSNLKCEEKNSVKVITKGKNAKTNEDDLKVYLSQTLNDLQSQDLTSQEKARIHRAINLVQRNLSQDKKVQAAEIPETFRPYLSVMTMQNLEEKKNLKEVKTLKFDEEAPKPDDTGRYILSEGENKVNHMKEAGWIGLETQLKRLLRLAFGRFTKKFDYFHEGEHKDPSKIYKQDPIDPIVDTGEVKITNISHACQLIQTNGFNILTDPVFYGLAPIVYPAQTKPAVEPEDLPAIDVIVISHNHRDHFDEPTLKKILKSGQNPMIVVPPGKDKKMVEKLGFTNVVELNWFEQQEFKKGDKSVLITAAAADHWSNRSAKDDNLSSVNSYVITPKDGEGVVYFAGDTAVMSPKRMKSIAAVLFLEMVGLKASGKETTDIKIYNLEPGGPNYARALMKTTHQSGVDSIVSAFKIAKHISELAEEFKADNDQDFKNIEPKAWLEKTLTVFMHHNKFELGPDRFNENVKIYKRLIDILESCESIPELQQKLKQIQEKDKKKGFLKRNLFNRSEDFIYAGAIELIKISGEIYGKKPGEYNDFKEDLIDSLKNKVVFPKIGESVTNSVISQPGSFDSNKRTDQLDESQKQKKDQLDKKLDDKSNILLKKGGYYHLKYLILEYANNANVAAQEQMQSIYSGKRTESQKFDIGELKVNGEKVIIDKAKLDKISDKEVMDIITKYELTKNAKDSYLNKNVKDPIKKEDYKKALERFSLRAKFKQENVDKLQDKIKWKEYKRK